MSVPSHPTLLFLAHTLPYPPDGGVWIRSFHVLRLLSRTFDVTALLFERSGEETHDADAALRSLEEFAEVEAFPVPQERSLTRKLSDHLKSLLRRRVFTVFKHQSEHFSTRLETLIEERDFDLVHVDSLDLSAHLPALEHLTVVCNHHNIESRLLRRRARSVSNPLLRAYIAFQARLQEQEEERWCDRVSLNVTVSEVDLRTLEGLVPAADVTVVPNGVDTDYFHPVSGRSDPGDEIVFVGGSWWHPNHDGMLYFARDILPLVRKRHPDVRVTWVGRTDPSTRKVMEEKYGIEMTGYAEDIRPYVHRSSCFVVPIRVGGGSRVKILDAWAMGKPVVSTRQGCEGLAAVDGENILLGNSPEEFSDAIHRVLTNRELRRHLAEGARRTVERHYSWDVIGDDLVETYLGLVNGADDEGTSRSGEATS